MNLKLALEWFLNPDHLPFLVAIENGYYKKIGIELEIIEPEGHYDGFSELARGNVHFATNEPLHLIEAYHNNVVSVGNFFETSGGIIFTDLGYNKLLTNKEIYITSPVSNDVTDNIARDIISRHLKKNNINRNAALKIVVKDFYHIKNLKDGMDAAWLCFENFEGVESNLEGIKVKKIYLEDVDIPNFCALDLFTSENLIKSSASMISDFVESTELAIKDLREDFDFVKSVFYKFCKEDETELMNRIIKNTMPRFFSPFDKSRSKWRSLYNYTKVNKITNVTESQYENMFYEL